MFEYNIFYKEGDIQFNTCETTVLPVNCDGKMDGEVASIFRRRNPSMFERYRFFCEQRLLVPGKIWIYSTKHGKLLLLPMPEDKTVTESLQVGLAKIVLVQEERDIQSIAMPMVYGKNEEETDYIKSLLTYYLCKMDIPVEIYTKHIPRSKTLIPLIERLCGSLTNKDIEDIKRKLCFEID